MSLIFHALSQHQDLLDKTKTYLKSFKQKDIEEATTTLRPHAYDLYSMLPSSIITQANKHLTKNGKPEWDVTGSTSSKEFYDFFKIAISVAHKKQPLLMGHETEASAKSPANRVCLGNNERAHGGNHQQGGENHSRHKDSGKSDPPPNPPSPSGVEKKQHKDKCKFCQAMLEEKIKTNHLKFDKVQTRDIIPPKQHEVLCPERCAYFMKIGMEDRVRVLKRLKLCTTCAGFKHPDNSCWEQWKIRGAQHFRCAAIVNQDKKHVCSKAWYVCTNHLDENDEKANAYFSKHEWTPSRNAQHEHVIMHFRDETKVQADYPMSVDLDLPKVPTITRQALTMNDEEINVEFHPTQTLNQPKLLFVYDALSDVVKTIKLIGDTGATIGLANKNDLKAIGSYSKRGTTKISGVANKQIEETATIVVSLESDFANKWQPNKFEVAVLPAITHVNEADHTKAVEEALKALQAKCPDFMKKHRTFKPHIPWVKSTAKKEHINMAKHLI